MTTMIVTAPAPRHPGAEGARPSSRGPTVFDDAWRSVIDQRIDDRLTEAGDDRLARLADRTRRGPRLRARFGRALIGIGGAIAGPTEDSSTAGHPA